MNVHKRRLPILLLIVLSITAVTTLIIVQPTQAAINCDDSSWIIADETNLNDAITCYNGKTIAGDYTITFSQNISLTVRTTVIENTTNGIVLTVDGEGFTLDGQGNIGGVAINTNTTVIINNSTISGNSQFIGAGIYNSGTLTINNNILSSNSADGSGGGIYNSGTLTINNSTLSDNSAGSSGGGGIFNSGTLTINNSTLSSNSTSGVGGGILNYGTLIIINSTLSGNIAVAGGGIENYGTLTINNSTLSNNIAHNSLGGGILNDGTLTINNSTISGNIANGGGGIGNDGSLTINNSTLSDNSASAYGGGILNIGYGIITINSSTLSGNSASLLGGGIENYNTENTISIRNSIINNSSSGGDCHNSGTVIDNGHNIVKDNSCGFTGGSDPLLGPLQDNGGVTYTHALLPGSPAIDAGNTLLTTDQRGIARPQGNNDDIGAFEVVQYALTINQAGTSTGSVTSQPAGIDCKPTCSANFVDGTVVTLTDTADTNAKFVGWSGADCNGIGTCVVTMDATKSVTATFNASYKVYLSTILK